MTNSSLTYHFFEDTERELYEYIFNISRDHPELIFSGSLGLIYIIIYILIFLICVIGMVGNGITIWLLGFCMKRNPFTTYILNLAVADIGVLTAILSIYILGFISSGTILLGGALISYVYLFMYITDQLILTVVSIDRCVAVLFPIWHLCHRPPRFSSIICVFMWVLSFLISGLDILLMFANQFILLQFIVNVIICTPLMAVSSVLLLIKICTKSQQHKRGKLLIVILLALFFFLMFGFPVNYLYFLYYYYILDDIDFISLFMSAFGYSTISLKDLYMLLSRMPLIEIPAMVALVCIVLNCSINPVVYFLAGRKKKGQSRLSMKVAFQRVFMDEENCRRQQGSQIETQF